jgi:hypothetical protein
MNVRARIVGDKKPIILTERAGSRKSDRWSGDMGKKNLTTDSLGVIDNLGHFGGIGKR